MKQSIKSIIIVVLAVFITLIFNMNMDIHTAIEYSFTGNTINHIAIFILMYWLLKNTFEIKNKRLSIICIILAI